MQSKIKSSYLRIIDANLNRSREGLRVCEDITRFVINDKVLTAAFKSLRHRLKELSRKIYSKYNTLAARRVKADVGKKSTKSEILRKDFADIFSANIQRTKESFRVLEEISKVVSEGISNDFKKSRFRLYELEKKSIPKIRHLCNS